MSDDVIDLGSYLGGQPPGKGGAFALWGAEGERSRFALPLWRVVYLLDGDRGGVLWTPARNPAAAASPFFVLDLAREPARTEFEGVTPETLAGEEAPSLAVGRGSAAVLLGRDQERVWWLVVTGPDVGREPPESGAREDVLFLAGECAGLLMHRGLGEEVDGEGEG